MRKGVFKTYVRKTYNDSNVKGTIDIARHIVKNTPFVGNVAYSQREYSFDNDLMELIRHTVEFIKHKPYGHKLLAQAKDEVKDVVAATPTTRCVTDRRLLMQIRPIPLDTHITGNIVNCRTCVYLSSASETSDWNGKQEGIWIAL